MLVAGTHLRVYYDPATKAHPDAEITSPESGTAIGETQDITCDVGGASVSKVEYVGLYDGVNWEGDGYFKRWHYCYFHTVFERHIGTAESGPDYKVTWNTQWVPDQTGVRLAARVHASDGTIFMTPAVANLAICRPDMTVEMPEPQPLKGWVTRTSGQVTQDFTLTGDPSKAIRAMIFEKGWGDADPDISVNGTSVGKLGAGGYNFSFTELDIPGDKAKSVLKSGTNSITMGGGGEHGHEAEYPGMMLVVQYSATNDCAVVPVRGPKPVASVLKSMTVKPSGDMITFSVTSNLPCKVSIVKSNGVVARSMTVQGSGSHSVTTSGLAEGIYLVRMKSGAKESVSRFSVIR
jgi:hypothetical protein